MLNTASDILGDYATVSPMETFTESKWDRHPTELAGLRGARMVTAQETERGRKWAEARVKALTGGDPIKARFMRQDFFKFKPEFKLLIAANDKPAIASVDEAIRRRFHLIPFEQHIDAAHRDEQLAEKLTAEWPAILAWMIQGTQLWLEDGLKPPERVQAATEAYLEEQDLFGSWLVETCRTGPREWASVAGLYDSWSTWAKRQGEEPGTSKSFSGEMSKRGFTSKKDSTGRARGFQGVSIKPDTENAYKSKGDVQREVWQNA
jgi:putative DNA primase/helicase